MQFHVYILADKFCIDSIFVFQDENKPKVHIFKIAEDDLRYRYMGVWESFSTKPFMDSVALFIVSIYSQKQL